MKLKREIRVLLRKLKKRVGEKEQARLPSDIQYAQAYFAEHGEYPTTESGISARAIELAQRMEAAQELISQTIGGTEYGS